MCRVLKSKTAALFGTLLLHSQPSCARARSVRAKLFNKNRPVSGESLVTARTANIRAARHVSCYRRSLRKS